MLPYLEANREAGEGKASEEGVCLSNQPPKTRIRRARRPNVPDLTRAPPPPFFGSVHSKGVAKADSGSAHSKGHTGTIVISFDLVLGETEVGATESGAIFYRGSVEKNRSKVNKKARGLGSPRSELRTARYSLEDNFCNELHVEGFPGTNARSAKEVTSGIGHEAESLTGVARGTRGCCPAVAAHGCGSLRQIDPVREVVHLGAELDFEPLRDGDVLENREIHSCIAGTVELIAGEVADRARRRYGECRGVPPLDSCGELVGNSGVRIANQVQA